MDLLRIVLLSLKAISTFGGTLSNCSCSFEGLSFCSNNYKINKVCKDMERNINSKVRKKGKCLLVFLTICSFNVFPAVSDNGIITDIINFITIFNINDLVKYFKIY